MEKTKVAFIFAAPEVDPMHITHALQLEPTYFHAKGAPRIGNPAKGYATGLWELASNLDPTEPIGVHITYLLDKLDPHRDGILQLEREGYDPAFYCGLFFSTLHTYLSLDAATLERMGRLGAEFNLQLYAVGEEESDAEGS